MHGAAAAAAPEKAKVTPEQLANAFNNDHGDDYDDHDDDRHQLVSLNAFDLVSQCGGFMVDRMFCPEFFYTASAAPTDDAEKDTRSFSSKVGGAVLFGQSSMTVRNKSSKSYHYSSGCAPQDIIKKVYDALKDMNFTFADIEDHIIQQCSLKADLLSAKGMVGMFVQAFDVSPELSLVEIKRGKGDILEWNSAFTELMEKKIGQYLKTEPIEE